MPDRVPVSVVQCAVTGVLATLLGPGRTLRAAGPPTLGAVVALAGLVPSMPANSPPRPALAATALRSGGALAYLEVHIEQGPYLESVDAPVGGVTAISGQSRILVAFTGEAGHAGTVPMHLRRDPVPAAAEIALAAENLARHTSGLLATVGTIEVIPGASNVIPGQARFSIDVRHPENAVRTDAVSVLERRVREAAATRSLGVEWRIARDHSAVRCDASLTTRLAEALAAARLPVGPRSSAPGQRS